MIDSDNTNNVKVERVIYLDNAATTRVDFMLFDLISDAMFETYGNPSSLHNIGKEAANKVRNARGIIAECIGASPDEIIFTAGGSEADNLALRGIAPELKKSGKTTIITSQIEHHAILNTCHELEKDGFTVVYMPVDEDGRVDIEELEKIMGMYKETLGLVSIMAVNNEIGSVQLIDDIGDLCQEYGCLFMTDAVQGIGHIELNVKKSHIDLMSMSGHKIYAPKGIGVLYVRKGVNLSPIITGGGQENKLRAGTENVPGILAMACAVRLAVKHMGSYMSYYKEFRDTFFKQLDKNNVDYKINGDGGVPNIISLTLPGCESEAMLLLLNERHICVSAGSACTAGSLEPSHVLRALSLDAGDASCTLRISMGIFNNNDDMIAAADAIAECVSVLKSMLPTKDSNGEV